MKFVDRLKDMSPERWGTVRAMMVAAGVALVFGAVTWRATAVAMGGVHIGDAKTPGQKADASARQDIVDRNGELLATSLVIDSVAAAPQEIWDVNEFLDGLATVFADLDRDRLHAQMTDPGRKFVWIRRKVSPRQRQALFDLGLEGLRFEKEVQRIYTGGSLAGHLLGYTDIDSRGIAGLELAHDTQLSVGKAPLKLTIDSGVQFALEDELRFASEAFKIKGAAGIVLDARTGAVRAIASWPEMDPNRPADASPEARLNRVIGGLYELGSVFKPLTVASALEAGVLHPSDTFDLTEPLHVGRTVISDDHPIAARADVSDILAHSSNIGTVRISQLLEARRQTDFYDALGFFERPNVVFPGAAIPLVPDEWNELSLATASYGHGIAISPLALATAYTAVANGGEMVRPRFVELGPYDEFERKRVMSAPTAAVVAEMMRKVVTDGTGSRADVYGYEVAGKTGTAEKPIPGGYAQDRNISSFISLFPASRPEYVVLIVLDEPEAHAGQTGETAALNAAPVTGRLIARIAPMLDVKPVLDTTHRPSGFQPGASAVSDKRAL